MAENEQPSEALHDPFEGFAEQRLTLKKLVENRPQLELTQGIEELEQRLQNKIHPLYILPEGYGPRLFEAQMDIQERMLTLMEETGKLDFASVPAERKAMIKTMVDALVRDIEKFERDAEVDARKKLEEILNDPGMAKYRTQLMEQLGVKGSEEQFTAILKYVSDPVPAPEPKNPENWKPDDMQKLRVMHAKVSRRQYELINNVINLSILNLRDVEKFPNEDWIRKFTDEDRRTLLVSIGDFMNQRLLYKMYQGRAVEADGGMLKMYLLATGIELSEEYAEKVIPFGEPTKLTKAVDDQLWKFLKRTGERVDMSTLKATTTVRAGEFWARMSPELRTSILEGYQGAQKLLGASAPSIRTVVDFVNRSPVGKEFWNRLMVGSPVTIVLFIMYVNQSPNKLKATMNFMSFLTLSAGTGAFMQTWGAALWRQGILQSALWAKRAGNIRLYNKLRLIRLAPKNPHVQFVVVLAIAFGLAEPIDKFTTWIDEEVIPDTPEKRAANDTIDFATSGSALMHFATELNIPLLNIDPETDAIRYLGTDVTFIGPRGGRSWPTLEREKVNQIIDWNEKIDKVIANEWNPIQRQLFELEKADQGPWSDRQSFRYFGMVRQAKIMQDALAAEFVSRGQLRFPQSFDLLEIAVNDGIDERPDDAVRRMEDDGTITEGKMRAYIKSLSDKVEKDKELIKLWNDYRKLVDDIAMMTTTFRHLGIYNRAEWLGGNTWGTMNIGSKVQRGIAQEIMYLMKKEEILKFRANGAQTRTEFSRNLSSLSSQEMIKVKVKIPWLKDLFTADGTLTKMDSHFYKRSFIAAAEAAGLALPADHDINALFQELRDAVYNKETISLDTYMKIRDRFCDAVREYSEGKKGYAQAPGALASSLPSIKPEHLYYSEQIDPRAFEDFKTNGQPDGWQHMLAQLAFKEKLAAEAEAGRAGIVLVQQVIPAWGEESHYRLNIMTMTCIETKGKNPADWIVRIHRYQTARGIYNSGNESVQRLQTVADVGGTTTMPYTAWAAEHADALKKIEPSISAVMIANGVEPTRDQKREMDETRERADKSTTSYVRIPYVGEYRRSYDDGSVELTELPFVGIGEVPPYRFKYTKGGETTNYNVSSHNFWTNENFDDADRRMIEDVVTTPIPEKDQESLEGVMHLFGFFYRQEYYSNPEINVYKSVRDGVMDLYKASAPGENRKYFLRRLFQVLYRYRENGIRQDEGDAVVNWFKNNRYLFERANADQLKEFSEGEDVIGMWPDENGLYSLENEKSKPMSKVYFQYTLGRGWEWHPGVTDSNPNPDTWYPVSQINIPYIRDGREVKTSPSLNLAETILKLQKFRAEK